MNIEEKRELVESYTNWYHPIDFGDGVISTPRKEGSILTHEIVQQTHIDWDLPKDFFKDKDVLDIGAWDGYYSFYAEDKGAKSVTALDGWIWAKKGWASKEGFDIAKRIKQSNVKDVILDIMDATPEKIGTFDSIIFAGVLYHIPNVVDIFGVLKSLLRPNGQLFIETVNNPKINSIPYPVAEFHPENTRGIMWSLNKQYLTVILTKYGFTINRMYEFKLGTGNRLAIHCRA